MIKKLLPLILMAFMAPAVWAQNAQQVEINAQVSYGLGFASNTSLLNYVEPSSTTCTLQGATVVKVTHSTSDNAVALATLFPAITSPVVYGLADITTSPGTQVNWGLSAGGARVQMAAGGFSLNRVNGGTPTLYLDNPSGTTDAYVQVYVMGN